MRTLRALPIPVIATALIDEISTTVNGRDVSSYRPSFEGRKTAGETAQYFNAVGFCIKKDKQGTVEHATMFDGPARYVTKSCGNVVGGIAAPDPVKWLESIRGLSSE
jgi:hypothetical protein